MKVGIYTLGCKVNLYESEFITSEFVKAGYEIGEFTDICDIYVINTCTVTNTSDIKSRKIIRQAIRRNPDACVIAMGCFTQANPDIEIEGVDIVLGNKNKSKIIEYVDEYFKNKKEIRDDIKYIESPFEDMFITNTDGRTRAFVKIQDGCENFCSYCIIPYVRGKCRSKDFDKVIEEITTLVNNGYKEIVLTGIHTGNYGVDLNTNFGNLLREIVKIKNLQRLRISSIEMTELTEEVLEIIKENNVVVDHFHIPLQAGSDEVLKLMNRKYELSEFTKKLEEIRRIKPNCSISTDIIVGFPGETEELFEETIEYAKKVKFSKIHVFPYSLRSGTKAETLPNHIDTEEKKRRARELIKVSRDLEIDYISTFLNKELEVLIETSKDGYSYGHTTNFIYVKVKGDYSSEEVIPVKITGIEYPYATGEVVDTYLDK